MEKTKALENKVISEENGKVSVDWGKLISLQGKDEYSKTLNKLVEKRILKRVSWKRDDIGSFMLIGTAENRNPSETEWDSGRMISEKNYYFLRREDAIEYSRTAMYRQVAYNIYLIQLREEDIINR